MGAAARANAAERQSLEAQLRSLIENAIPFARHQLVDAFGQPIEVAGTYTFVPSLPIPVTVIDIAPDVRPQSPDGSYTITIQATISIPAMSRAGVRRLQRIAPPPTLAPLPGAEGTVSEPQPLAATANGPIVLTD